MVNTFVRFNLNKVRLGWFEKMVKRIRPDHSKSCIFMTQKSMFIMCRPLKCQHCPSTKRISYGNFETHLLSEHRISQWDITEEGVRVIEIEKQRAEKKVVG
jgi:hypothetical protein